MRGHSLPGDRSSIYFVSRCFGKLGFSYFTISLSQNLPLAKEADLSGLPLPKAKFDYRPGLREDWGRHNCRPRAIKIDFKDAWTACQIIHVVVGCARTWLNAEEWVWYPRPQNLRFLRSRNICSETAQHSFCLFFSFGFGVILLLLRLRYGFCWLDWSCHGLAYERPLWQCVWFIYSSFSLLYSIKRIERRQLLRGSDLIHAMPVFTLTTAVSGQIFYSKTSLEAALVK